MGPNPVSKYLPIISNDKTINVVILTLFCEVVDLV